MLPSAYRESPDYARPRRTCAYIKRWPWLWEVLAQLEATTGSRERAEEKGLGYLSNGPWLARRWIPHPRPGGKQFENPVDQASWTLEKLRNAASEDGVAESDGHSWYCVRQDKVELSLRVRLTRERDHPYRAVWSPVAPPEAEKSKPVNPPRKKPKAADTTEQMQPANTDPDWPLYKLIREILAEKLRGKADKPWSYGKGKGLYRSYKIQALLSVVRKAWPEARKRVESLKDSGPPDRLQVGRAIGRYKTA